VVNYRTAAVLCVVLIGGMFGFPRLVSGIFHSSSQQDVPTIVLGLADFCSRFKWVLALPIALTLFAVAAFTNKATSRHENTRGA
jgi:hypothetical protein